MMIMVTAIWGAGLALYLTHRSMECLGHLGTRLFQRPPRPRRLDRKIAENQVHRSRQRMQPRLVLSAPPNGNHSRSLRREGS